jgi:hypothetical protein
VRGLPAGPVGRRPPNRRATEPIPSSLVVVKVLVALGVVLFPVPALVMGARRLLKRPGYSPDEPADRASYFLVVGLRALALLLVFALSAVVLVSTIGAAIKNVELHGMVYVFFGLDLLLAVLIVLSFGRRDRRPARRRASPAAR